LLRKRLGNVERTREAETVGDTAEEVFDSWQSDGFQHDLTIGIGVGDVAHYPSLACRR
jgi:hypothetical protein